MVSLNLDPAEERNHEKDWIPSINHIKYRKFYTWQVNCKLDTMVVLIGKACIPKFGCIFGTFGNTGVPQGILALSKQMNFQRRFKRPLTFGGVWCMSGGVLWCPVVFDACLGCLVVSESNGVRSMSDGVWWCLLYVWWFWLCLVVTGVCLVVCVSGACHMLIIILQFLVQARGPYSRTCVLVFWSNIAPICKKICNELFWYGNHPLPWNFS